MPNDYPAPLPGTHTFPAAHEHEEVFRVKIAVYYEYEVRGIDIGEAEDNALAEHKVLRHKVIGREVVD